MLVLQKEKKEDIGDHNRHKKITVIIFFFFSEREQYVWKEYHSMLMNEEKHFPLYI